METVQFGFQRKESRKDDKKRLSSSATPVSKSKDEAKRSDRSPKDDKKQIAKELLDKVRAKKSSNSDSQDKKVSVKSPEHEKKRLSSSKSKDDTKKSEKTEKSDKPDKSPKEDKKISSKDSSDKTQSKRSSSRTGSSEKKSSSLTKSSEKDKEQITREPSDKGSAKISSGIDSKDKKSVTKSPEVDRKKSSSSRSKDGIKKSEKSEKPGKLEKPEHSERSDRPDKPPKVDEKVTVKNSSEKDQPKKSSESVTQGKKPIKSTVVSRIKKSLKNQGSIKTDEDYLVKGKEPVEQPISILNSDYIWYFRYYMQAYGMDLHSAAYYAQYHISTVPEYQSLDLPAWFEDQGYNVLSINSARPEQDTVKTLPFVLPKTNIDPAPTKSEPVETALEPKSEETPMETNTEQPVNTSADIPAVKPDEIEMATAQATLEIDESVTDKPKETSMETTPAVLEPVEAISDGKPDEVDMDTSTDMVKVKREEVAMDIVTSCVSVGETTDVTKSETTIEPIAKDADPVELGEKIRVIIPKIPLSSNEMLLASGKSPEPEFYQEEPGTCESPPPPPPPPIRPTMTHLKSEKEIWLPNGRKLPIGTEQIIIHPYPSSHPFTHVLQY